MEPRPATIAAVAAATLALPALCTGGGTALRSHTAAPQTLAVGYSSPALAAALRGRRVQIVRRLPGLRVAEVRPAAGDADRFARVVRARPGIRWVEAAAARRPAAEPALVPSRLGVAPEWQYAATHADAVPAAVLRAASAFTIAIVDTGADLAAPDLAAKSPTSWSVVSDSPDVADTSGHGTFVASLAGGAVDNGDGIAGFGGDARVLIVQANRVDSTFTDLDEADAIVWAVDHGARIVNLSLGGPSTSRTERNAIDYAAAHGVLLVAAAGNGFDHGNPVEYPAALIQSVGSNGVGGRGLVVAASTAAGARASFSSSGSYVSLAAPGVDVVGAVASTAPARAYPPVTLPGSTAGVYGLGSGTSYSAPEVAGAAALVWAASPGLTAVQVAHVLKATASGRGTWNEETGWGVLDVAAAVSAAARGDIPPAAVLLRGRRAGKSVRLAWAGDGASAYRLRLSRDGARRRVLLEGTKTAASYPVAPGHTYVFTVDAVDAAGAPIASSTPYRLALAGPAAPKATAARAR